MLSVTFKLVDVYSGVPHWAVFTGAGPPPLVPPWNWQINLATPVFTDIVLAVSESDRYFRGGVGLGGVGGWGALGDTLGPIDFIDGATYDWDAITNTLTLEVPALPPERFLDAIFSFVWGLVDNLRGWADSIWTWIPGYEWFHDRLYDISDWFWNLLTPIAHASDWVDAVVDKVSQILGPEGIISLLQTWLTYAENCWDWVRNAPARVFGLATDWWNDPDNPIRLFIDTATEGLPALIVAVDNFFTVTLPTLFDVKYAEEWWKGKAVDLVALIDSKVKELDPFWIGWKDVKDNVVNFISSPLDWLWERFTDWFLGKE